ncbi:MAG: hypothetical protein WBA87_15635 [Microbacterium sp.]
MFNPQFDDARQTIANSQEHMLTIGELLNALHPESGGNGLDDPIQTHRIVGQIAAEVHNIAFALGGVIDVLDQDHSARS